MLNIFGFDGDNLKWCSRSKSALKIFGSPEGSDVTFIVLSARRNSRIPLAATRSLRSGALSAKSQPPSGLKTPRRG